MKEPLSFYANQKGGDALKFYVIDCGQGLMNLIVFPDSSVMLFDCNVTEENKNGVLEFLERVIPKRENTENKKQWIDIFVNSHRDTDHLRGLKAINEKFPIYEIWDSGQYGENTENSDYEYYMKLRRELKEESSDNVKELVPFGLPIESFGNSEIYCLSAKAEPYVLKQYDCSEESVKAQHNNCIVLLIKYAGRKLLLTGDSDWKAWRDDISPIFGTPDEPNYKNIDILVASHHGSRSFFTDEENENIDEKNNPETTYLEHIKLMKPKITLISCGDYSQHYHPNEEVVEIYKKYTSNKQVYTTHNFRTFDGIINNNGHFTVVPDFFQNSKPMHGPQFEIVCNGGSVKNGDYHYVKENLTFSLRNIQGMLQTGDKISVCWAFSNGGIGNDSDHQEIYFNDKYEKDKFAFSRELFYEGTHLLYCKMHNRTKGIMQTQVFKITYVKQKPKDKGSWHNV